MSRLDKRLRDLEARGRADFPSKKELDVRWVSLFKRQRMSPEPVLAEFGNYSNFARALANGTSRASSSQVAKHFGELISALPAESMKKLAYEWAGL